MGKPISIAASIREIQSRIAGHEAEIERLRAELEEARDVLNAPGQVDSSKPADSLYQQHVKRTRLRALARGSKRPIRENSSVGFARRILQQLGTDLEAGVLAEMVSSNSGVTVSKATLVSSLSRYVKAENTFTRPKPGHYGLREHVVKSDLLEVG